MCPPAPVSSEPLPFTYIIYNMPISKDSILALTDRGYLVFRHFLGHRFVKPGKAFKSPFYEDTKASCYVYLDKKSGIYKYKDFGDLRYSGDCFAFVGKLMGLSCSDHDDFVRILQVIDAELVLNIDANRLKTGAIIRASGGKVRRASQLPGALEGVETATAHYPVHTQPFTPQELSFWQRYGIQQGLLERYGVCSVERFNGTGKEGRKYVLQSTEKEPIFAYQVNHCMKLYRPFSELRFLFAGEKTESYIFGLDKLPQRGGILFITGGEKDVLSLTAHGFHSICFNSETANIPKNRLRDLSFRFKHVVLLYDVDKTGLASMEKLTKEHQEFGLKSLRLPLSGEKHQKDVSDFFQMGNGADDLMMLFCELLDKLYEDTLAVMRSCEVDFDNPPLAPEPLIAINEVPIGSPGNLVCITGSEGSGKTNFLGGILSGALRPEGAEIDTLGTTVRDNPHGYGVLLYDTEQAEYQFYKNLTHILRRAELERPPGWLKAFCLVGISRGERMTRILESMDRYYYEYGGIHLVVIDGIADLLAGVNDEESSVWLIDELFRIAAIYRTVIVCILHTVPTGLKLRGHLGSEMQRKAAGILLIEKEEDGTGSLVKALKLREGSPLDVPIIRFAWDKTLRMHVFAGELGTEAAKERKLSDLRFAASEIFRERSQVSAKELKQGLMTAFGVQERMARTYLQVMREAGILESDGQKPANYRFLQPYEEPKFP